VVKARRKSDALACVSSGGREEDEDEELTDAERFTGRGRAGLECRDLSARGRRSRRMEDRRTVMMRMASLGMPAMRSCSTSVATLLCPPALVMGLLLPSLCVEVELGRCWPWDVGGSLVLPSEDAEE
jgi:hypothetical protein